MSLLTQQGDYSHQKKKKKKSISVKGHDSIAREGDRELRLNVDGLGSPLGAVKIILAHLCSLVKADLVLIFHFLLPRIIALFHVFCFIVP